MYFFKKRIWIKRTVNTRYAKMQKIGILNEIQKSFCCYDMHITFIFFSENFVHNRRHCITKKNTVSINYLTILLMKQVLVNIIDRLDFVFDCITLKI